MINVTSGISKHFGLDSIINEYGVTLFGFIVVYVMG
jgi:hypothetical protein